MTFVLRIYNAFDLQYMYIHFRFLPEEIAKRDSFSYLPYGQGPRMCPGLKFADLQVKVALVKLLQKFVIKPCQQTIVSTYCVIQCKAVMFLGRIRVYAKEMGVLSSCERGSCLPLKK